MPGGIISSIIVIIVIIIVIVISISIISLSIISIISIIITIHLLIIIIIRVAALALKHAGRVGSNPLGSARKGSIRIPSASFISHHYCCHHHYHHCYHHYHQLLSLLLLLRCASKESRSSGLERNAGGRFHPRPSIFSRPTGKQIPWGNNNINNTMQQTTSTMRERWKGFQENNKLSLQFSFFVKHLIIIILIIIIIILLLLLIIMIIIIITLIITFIYL